MSQYERVTLSPAEREIDRPRSDAYYMLKATMISIQRPGSSIEDIEHGIENLRRAMTKLEEHADLLDPEGAADRAADRAEFEAR